MALIDRIKFDAPSDDILVWKFPSEELTRVKASLTTAVTVASY